MKTRTRLRQLRVLLAVLAAHAVLTPPGARSLPIDDRGEMRLGLRAYTDVRIGTEKEGGAADPNSYPKSGTGHIHQNRFFLELKFDHDLTRLAREGAGVARVFGFLDPSNVRYSLQYRGEGEGIYDYGPAEWSEQARALRQVRLDAPNFPTLGLSNRLPEAYIEQRIAALRRNARQRHRFFMGYLDFEKGPVFLRFGRQVLAWGETDVFRLLDNINPLDNGFGGFFIALDERRVPVDMARGSYRLGTVGPLHDAFIEAFLAGGNKVSTVPGILQGSPWEPGGLGFPIPYLKQPADVPDFDKFRGGGRLVFNHHNVTYTLAHYYTYLDVPGVVFHLPGTRTTAIGQSNFPNFQHPILAIQEFPRVSISGGSLTFPVPSWYSVVRSEVAYIIGEPLNRQGRGNPLDSQVQPTSPGYKAAIARLEQQNNTEGGLDPFLYPRFLDQSRNQPFRGNVLQRNTFNAALGLDVNRFFRALNPGSTFFITTQFFYKHVFDSPGDLVLPVIHHLAPLPPEFLIAGKACGRGGATLTGRPCRLQPRLFHLNDDQFLHTLAITTPYSGGRVLPVMAVFYDWQGVWLAQPGVTLVRDPFRFVVDYTYIAGPPTGQIGTLRDRDNVRFQIEYVF